jgi:hypothetical protein
MRLKKQELDIDDIQVRLTGIWADGNDLKKNVDPDERINDAETLFLGGIGVGGVWVGPIMSNQEVIVSIAEFRGLKLIVVPMTTSPGNFHTVLRLPNGLSADPQDFTPKTKAAAIEFICRRASHEALGAYKSPEQIQEDLRDHWKDIPGSQV